MKKSSHTETSKDFLFELGVEELPARFVPLAMEALERHARRLFAEEGLNFSGSLQVFGTPRRLALHVPGLSAKSAERSQEFLGPPLAQSKDAQGNWTPAAQGFARSQGMTPEQLEVKKTEKGDRLCAVKRSAGRPTEKILPELLPKLIRLIELPKSMVWEESRLAFARPIRWIAAVYGNQPVKFELAGVRAGKNTFALRAHGGKPLPVPSPAKYRAFLKDHCVIVDVKERRELIEKQIQNAVKPAHGRVRLARDAALLDEVVHLVEHPVAIVGKFDPAYLKLPPEVLTTSMKKHQKFFPVYEGAETRSPAREEEENGKLLPHFVGIRNGISDNQAIVREGYERVLSARLSDAAFFFEQDRQTRLEAKAVELKSVLFQKELGSLWDKSERVIRLVERLLPRIKISHESAPHSAGRIAFLAKADLVTAMVGEFPELQGVMGRIYAALDGEGDEIADGIEQHYWPLTAEGELPVSEAAALVSLADKIDTLSGDFLAGLIPTGSQDPYGLRRAAVGVLRILSDKKWTLDLNEMIGEALDAFPATVPGDRAATRKTLLDFFRQRWTALMEARGHRFDEVQAVSTEGFGNVVDAERRLSALGQARRNPSFDSISVAFKRADNILTQARKKGIFSEDTVFAPERLAEPAEKDLHASLSKIELDLQPVFEAGDYRQALETFVELRENLDRFFEKTMVMVPEADLRSNRLALLNQITGLIRRVADLSRLQETPAGLDIVSPLKGQKEP
jgi:glycyl-tRNA synthetase beta chain